MINIKLALLSTLFSKKFSLRDEDICHFSLLQSFLGPAGQLQIVQTLIILCTRIPFPYNRMDWNSTVEPLKFKGTVASLDFQEIIIRIDLGIKVSQVTKCSKLQSAPSYTVSPNLKCVLSYIQSVPSFGHVKMIHSNIFILFCAIFVSLRSRQEKERLCLMFYFLY